MLLQFFVLNQARYINIIWSRSRLKTNIRFKAIRRSRKTQRLTILEFAIWNWRTHLLGWQIWFRHVKRYVIIKKTEKIHGLIKCVHLFVLPNPKSSSVFTIYQLLLKNDGHFQWFHRHSISGVVSILWTYA